MNSTTVYSQLSTWISRNSNRITDNNWHVILSHPLAFAWPPLNWNEVNRSDCEHAQNCEKRSLFSSVRDNSRPNLQKTHSTLVESCVASYLNTYIHVLVLRLRHGGFTIRRKYVFIGWNGGALIEQSPVWARERCRISPPCFLAECCKRQLNQGSFVLLYFRLFTFSDLHWVCLSVFSCTVLFVKWLAVKTASKMTYIVSSGALNSTPTIHRLNKAV